MSKYYTKNIRKVKELNYKTIKDKRVYKILKSLVYNKLANNRMNEIKLLIFTIFGILLWRWVFCCTLSEIIIGPIISLGAYCFVYGVILLSLKLFENKKLHKFMREVKNETILYAEVFCNGLEKYHKHYFLKIFHKYYFLKVSSLDGQEVEKMLKFPPMSCEESIIGKKVYVVYAGKDYFVMEDISLDYWE